MMVLPAAALALSLGAHPVPGASAQKAKAGTAARSPRASVQPAKAPPADPNAKPPIDYSADAMQVEEHKGVLDGNVDLRQGDLHITGRHAVVEFAPKPAEAPAKAGQKAKPKQKDVLPAFGGQVVERFVIDGAVHVVKGARTADGETATYDARTELMTLSGPSSGAVKAPGPVLREGEETLTGEVLVLRMATDEVDVSEPRLLLHRSLEGQGPPQPTHIQAKRMLLASDRKSMRFTDSVVVKRGDLTVKAPKMVARTGEGGAIDDLVMDGGVELRQGTRTGKSERAVYSGKERTMRMTGAPQLTDRDDVLYGEVIDLEMDSKLVHVQKARAHLKPDAQPASPAKEGR
ncbi:MAG: hypothetical protein JST92_21170 [Deltaproteobacteria bacterium]|nr:hypothetical protein [Deltaproteobacteria bacterium]